MTQAMSETDTLPETAPAAPPLTPAALATRASIMDTADRLFRTLGYQKTTVADIARDLRMSPANIYRFFPSKAAITEAIGERVLDQLTKAVWDVVHSKLPAPDRLRGVFRVLQEQTVALFFHERRMHEMVAVALEEHWPMCDRYVQSIDSALIRIIRDGQADGVFSDMDAEQAGHLVHATTAMFSHPTLVEQCQDTKDLPALAQCMAEFCLRALRP
jgi:AcrR family transcriptional regulator